MKHYSIAIDGPAGAGKSTMAKRLAQALGYVYVDTGAIYRTVGYHMNLMGIGPKDADGINRLIGDVNLDITYDAQGTQHMILNGADVSDEIRTPEMSMIASTISAHKVVRDFLLDTQRDLAKAYNVVMDGRDIGTVVLPDADLKIYLTAAPEVRAQRRIAQYREQGQKVDERKILAEIIQRDEQDMNRPIAPLRRAKDAVLLDTSYLNVEETIARLLEIAAQRLG
ncbi:MAG: (d)CMP kinase [Ruminococcaceae bacterium]|jgi:cytidylate kinase|nr:(d)CMP kinase [Oscillospiraceae bacterium]